MKSNCWFFAILFLIQLASLMSSPTASREHLVVKPAANTDVKLKSGCISIDKLKTATRGYVSAPNDSTDSSNVIRKYSSGQSTEVATESPSSTIAGRLGLRNTQSRQSMIEKRDDDVQNYLNSPHDAKWVAQCLSGGQCTKGIPFQNIKFPKDYVLKHPKITNSDNGVTLSDETPRSEGNELKASESYHLQAPLENYTDQKSGHRIANNVAQDVLNLDVHYTKGLNVVPSRISGTTLNDKFGYEKPLVFQFRGDGKLASPILSENRLTGIKQVDISHYNYSQGNKDQRIKIPISGDIDSKENGYMDSKQRGLENFSYLSLPGGFRGELKIGSVNSTTINSFKDLLSIGNKNLSGLGAVISEPSRVHTYDTIKEFDNISLRPVAIHLEPVIHNHYYTRRQTKSDGSEKNDTVSSDNELPNILSINATLSNRLPDDSPENVRISSTNTVPPSSETKPLIMAGGLCGNPNQCLNPVPIDLLSTSIENDRATRDSPGKQQYGSQDSCEALDENSSVDFHNDSVKTKIVNLNYPEDQKTNLPLDYKTDSNIYLIMGGHYVINFSDNPDIVQVRSKPSTNPTSSSLHEQRPPYSIDSKNSEPRGLYLRTWQNPSYCAQKQVGTPRNRNAEEVGISNSNKLYWNNYETFPFINRINPYNYYNHNSNPLMGRTPSIEGNAEQTGIPDYANTKLMNYVDNVSDGQYYVTDDYKARHMLPSFATPEALDYQESLINFPLNTYYLQNTSSDRTVPNPEQFREHDMSPSDMLVFGAQLVSELQKPEDNLPDEKDSIAQYSNYASKAAIESVRPMPQLYNRPDHLFSGNIRTNLQNFGGNQVVLSPQIVPKFIRRPSAMYSIPNSWISQPASDYDFVSGQYIKLRPPSQLSPS